VSGATAPVIGRDLAAAGAERYDLVVVGGGVQGVAVALEAARRGLRSVLVERDDFGGATTWNSLRIVHGGLRYLQRADLPRFRASVAERSWWLRNFPDRVEPLPCLMPLYGRGLRRPGVLRWALRLDDRLSSGRNRGLPEGHRLPAGTVLDAEEVVDRFPAVRRKGLRGGALWFDARAADSQRLVMEMLRWATAACGGRALNYLEARRLLLDGGRVAGVVAVDRESGESVELSAPLVVNCAGPWCREVARRFGADAPSLFRPSIAGNLLLDRPPPAAEAVAVECGGNGDVDGGGGSYFLHPWKGRILAGTFHAPVAAGESPDPRDDASLDEALVHAFLRRLNRAVPSLDLGPGDVLRRHWGLLPAKRAGTASLATRPAIVDHGRRGGPEGLWSVSGVKLTTARRVAEETLARCLRRRALPLPPYLPEPRPEPRTVPSAAEIEALAKRDPDAAGREVRTLMAEESALTLDDLVLRRTDWGMLPETGRRLRELLAGLGFG